MKILIAVDMEGISGVVHWSHVTPGHAEYERFRRIMTADVNAALKGAAQAGADEILVTDGHWDGNNLLLEELDPRARLNAGNGSPFSMMQGIDQRPAAVLFVGYHARCGSQNAVLDHTWSSKRVANVWLNGSLTGEVGLNAAVAGHFNVPVILVTGDQTVCAEASELLPGVEVLAVKQATGRMSAECLPLEVAHQRIREAATRAMSRFRAEMGPQPYKPQLPVTVKIEFITSYMADQASLLPGTTRLNGKQIEFTADDMVSAYRTFRSAVALAPVE